MPRSATACSASPRSAHPKRAPRRGPAQEPVQESAQAIRAFFATLQRLGGFDGAKPQARRPAAGARR